MTIDYYFTAMPVEFDEENNISASYAKFQQSPEQSRFVRMMISSGIAKTPERANMILVIIIIIIFIVTGYVLYKTNGNSNRNNKPTSEQVQYMKNETAPETFQIQ